MRVALALLLLAALPAQAACTGDVPTPKTGAAVQALIDAGRPVALRGRYAVSAPLKLRAGARLCGEPRSALTGRGWLLRADPPADDVQLVGVTLDGGSLLAQGSGWAIDRLAVRNVPAGDSAQISSGVTLVGWSGTLTGSTFERIADTGVIGWAVSGRIERNTFADLGTGLHVIGARDLVIAGNTAARLGSFCYEVQPQGDAQEPGIVVDGNRCTNRRGISIVAGLRPLIVDNEVTCAALPCVPGIGIEFSGIGAIVTGNSVRGFEAGISGWVNPGAPVYLLGNRITDARWSAGRYGGDAAVPIEARNVCVRVAEGC